MLNFTPSILYIFFFFIIFFFFFFRKKFVKSLNRVNKVLKINKLSMVKSDGFFLAFKKKV